MSSETKIPSSFGSSSEQGFFDRNIAIRIFLGLLALFAMGSFMHFREPTREKLELNKKAGKYIVAQVDFSFFNKELTDQLRQEVVRDIGPIYKLDEKEVREQVQTFDRSLLGKSDWRSKVGTTSFEEITQSARRLAQVLVQARFSDRRTEKELARYKLNQDKILVFNPNNPRRGERIPLELWHALSREAALQKNLSPEASALLLKFFRSRAWKFEEDRKLRDEVRREAKSQVEDVYTEVAAGERLVDQDELITSKHILMLQAMKRAMQESRNLWHPLTLLGSFTLSFVILFICVLYFRAYHQEILRSNKRIFLLVVLFALTLFVSKVMEYFLLNTGGLFELVRYPLYVPFCAIMIASLLNARVAIFTSGLASLILSITLSVDVVSFILLNTLGSIFAVFSSQKLFKRKDIFSICFRSWLGVLCIIIALNLFNNAPWSWSFVTDLVSTLACMMLTAILVAGLLPLFETVFNILTNITLMEYMDPNNELLRRLMIEAPGTYQHSMLVGNLAEAGASAIGANGLFCRVSTLYHDIGKLANPYYFSENQQGGVNMHQLLTPLESAQVIIGHVRDGVALARKEGLPEPFIDIIKEHHGTTLAQCMYHEQCVLMGGDKGLVDERDFRYSGPKPHSRESAIIMIADVLEAASRTLPEFTEENLTDMVNNLVKTKSEDGQFDECSLTFEELGIVKKSLVKTLLMAGHSRVKYPYQLSEEEANAQIDA